MTIGIVIATYQRSDGTTPRYLTKALNSIKNQTYADYKVFLIGDKYENSEEFNLLANSIIPKEKIFSINLPYAMERDKYPLGNIKLWCAGGVNAVNYGIDCSLKEGIHYISHLDHDDWWEPTHLEEISKQLKYNPIIIATLATYKNNEILPKIHTLPYLPKNGDLIHSATCVNFNLCPFRYRDVYAIEGRHHATDGDLWERLSDYIAKSKLNSILIPKITCHHENERY